MIRILVLFWRRSSNSCYNWRSVNRGWKRWVTIDVLNRWRILQNRSVKCMTLNWVIVMIYTVSFESASLHPFQRILSLLARWIKYWLRTESFIFFHRLFSKQLLHLSCWRLYRAQIFWQHKAFVLLEMVLQKVVRESLRHLQRLVNEVEIVFHILLYLVKFFYFLYVLLKG